MNEVNKAQANTHVLKSGDSGSTITINLSNLEKKAINNIDYIRLYHNDETQRDGYISVTDFDINFGQLQMRLPLIAAGEYQIEIKDTEGRIYPSESPLKLTLLKSTSVATEVYYVSYKDHIISELPDMIAEHMTQNIEKYRGVQGIQGESAPPQVYTRDEYESLSTKDPHTLYFIQGSEEAK